MSMEVRTRIEEALGSAPRLLHPLPGGSVAAVYRVDLADGRRLVAKFDPGPDARLATEGQMLRHLKKVGGIPVPGVHHAEDSLLIMDFVESDGRSTPAGEEEAAELVAGLHGHGAPAYGFAYDTLIGGLPQPNPWTTSWIDFFARDRLLFMGARCVEAGRMEPGTLRALETLCGRLGDYLEPAPPALIHGDLWGGNVLWHQGRVAAFVDPALYYADPEIELAFTTLFTTFGPAFHARYHELRPLRPGFHQVRKDLYNLYPLLVHVRLFGGSYLAAVKRTLGRFVQRGRA
jgi:fructosamine-3-kinase